MNIFQKFVEYQVPETIEECENEIQQEELRAAVGNLQGSKKDVEKLAELEKEEQGLMVALQKNDDIVGLCFALL